MGKKSDLFLEVAALCPHPVGSGEYVKWVFDEMSVCEAIETELHDLRMARQAEEARHRKAVDQFNERLAKFQKKCRHKMSSSFSQMLGSSCDRCGWVDDREPCGYDG